MKPTRSIFCLLSTFLLIVMALPANAQKPDISIVTTIPILSDIAKTIAGGGFDITSLIRANDNIHTYQQKPSGILKLEKADVFIKMGLGLDSWANDIVQTQHNKSQIVITASDSIPTISESKNHTHDNERHSGTNPHIWLDPINVDLIAENIFKALQARYPEKAGLLAENKSRFSERLATLDSQIKKLFSGIQNKNIVTYHPAWPYFSKRYGFTVIDSIINQEGSEPSATAIIQLIKKINQHNVKVIIGEPQASMKLPWLLESETNAKVLTLSVMPGLARGEDNYIDMMYINAKKLEEALKNQVVSTY